MLVVRKNSRGDLEQQWPESSYCCRADQKLLRGTPVAIFEERMDSPNRLLPNHAGTHTVAQSPASATRALSSEPSPGRRSPFHPEGESSSQQMGGFAARTAP